MGLAGSKDPANAGASAPSPDVGERAEDGRGGWVMVVRRQAKAGGSGSNSSPTASRQRFLPRLVSWNGSERPNRA